jgi:O-antigen ligase
VAGPASFYNQNGGPKVPENYFVQLAQELGFIGAALFIGITCMIAYQLWRRRQQPMAQVLLASLVGITVVNFFLHGWADDPTSMTWWGILGLYLFADNEKR